MTPIFKYYVAGIIFIGCLLRYSRYYRILWDDGVEPFNTDWNPITDPNHVQHHKNEISYLTDWIAIMERDNKQIEADQLKFFMIPKERHLQWHLDRLPKPPTEKQTKFLFF
jgi:hypothetical protein